MKTVNEMAAVCGVSEQAIRGWCRRNNVAKDAKATKGKGFAINETTEMAILLHYGVISAKDAKANESSCETFCESNESSCETSNETIIMLQKTISLLENQAETLQQQLALKDKQIEELNERLKESHILIDQQQKLQVVSESRLELLEDKVADPEQEEEPRKKHWWQFGKGK